MKSKQIAVISGVVISLAIVGIVIYTNNPESEIEDLENENESEDKLEEKETINLENEYTPKEREWISSGPFQIDRSEYVLGEKIFLRIGGLEYNEKGQVVFLRPLNDTHYSVYQSIPFDGAAKPSFNYYIDPAPSKANEICSANDITGNWTVMFRGTNYPNLKFEITDEILPGTEEKYTTSVC